MDNVENYDSYINIISLQSYISYLPTFNLHICFTDYSSRAVFALSKAKVVGSNPS
jgi:hypothetical protein